ncbi:hypothetical protein PybrP1_007693 [[Pythium] brassicae (nom. inval.)]|nr:hypothetical protein PybrP1_007693 [[Pythium] brassicae (nom. inval.)]
MTTQLLVVRVDLLRDRRTYVATLKSWLSELAIDGARLATTGSLHLLVVAASSAQLSQLLAFFTERPIDTDAKGALCVDKFIDVLGQKTVDDPPALKGFLEMNFLNTAMLERMLVGEWRADKQWLDEALATPRTKAFLAWRAASKAQRSERRKKSAQEKHAAKQQKREAQEVAAAAAAKTLRDEAADDAGADHSDKGEEEEDGDEGTDDKQSVVRTESPATHHTGDEKQQPNKKADVSHKRSTPSPTPTPTPTLNAQHQQPKKNKKRRKAQRDRLQGSKQAKGQQK